MKYSGNFLIIAKDGWPLEQFAGRPITNFFRRLFLGKVKVCRYCWEAKHAACGRNPFTGAYNGPNEAVEQADGGRDK